MAKATYHRHQRVYVEPVGTWAVIDKVNPVWVKGFDEPVRVTYDCGLGRDFAESELIPEGEAEARDSDMGNWRLMRARNKWQSPDESRNHPFPGTYPIVVTDVNDWGGWRVPGAEYERDPALIEMQARLIAAAPRMLKLIKDLREYARDNSAEIDDDLLKLARRAEQLRRAVETDVADTKMAE
ncbi:hypothetical protein ABI_26950 [Asticcacaulis biprosthecium C19]|uniref:Uncharacterized protein n=1 Tax=Asticcacaulis biprosthecium C19 TaxID=715226 RepID=F4QPM2_9CAUL|nr:hypothetical protein [Asticcacaulis biprosthecium]EGF91280.1 hypothetical protein ABI_26950 [Asticcacaulis biprosthecium C19]